MWDHRPERVPSMPAPRPARLMSWHGKPPHKRFGRGTPSARSRAADKVRMSPYTGTPGQWRASTRRAKGAASQNATVRMPAQCSPRLNPPMPLNRSRTLISGAEGCIPPCSNCDRTRSSNPYAPRAARPHSIRALHPTRVRAVARRTQRTCPTARNLSDPPASARVGYPPLDTPKPVADGVWIVDSLRPGSIGRVLPARMTAIRLPAGSSRSPRSATWWRPASPIGSTSRRGSAPARRP